MSYGTSNCTITVTDSAGNVSNTLAISFTFDTSLFSPVTSGAFVVVVGQSGTIVRSTDNGSSFSSVTSPTSNNLEGVGFGNNTFVAVCNNGTIVRSTDNGSSRDNVTSPTSYHLEEVGFGNNTFMGVGDSGTIMRSTDNGSSFLVL